MSHEKVKRIPALKTHDEMVEAWMNDPAFRAEYDSLKEEYQLIREKLHAGKRGMITDTYFELF